ncbi:hypothetical protein HJG60_012001 [Phyllostomus discolor]|uniref:Uncharacterized protein n=1 Tax=Phyllostomus discolor TaxID=89673 RepID=A0A833ZEF3_9CHIR|nr:hypothetical protein HJG60_012001 [Phyllostomus discolor]
MVASYRRCIFNFKELSECFPKHLCSCPLPAFDMFLFSHSRPSPAGVRLYDFVFNLRLFIYLVLERGERREKGEKHPRVLLCMPQLRTESATQACALTRNQTSDLLVCGMEPNQLNYTGQDSLCNFSYSNKCSIILHCILC